MNYELLSQAMELLAVVLPFVALIWIGRLLASELRFLREELRGIAARLKGIEDTTAGILKHLRSDKKSNTFGDKVS